MSAKCDVAAGVEDQADPLLRCPICDECYVNTSSVDANSITGEGTQSGDRSPVILTCCGNSTCHACFEMHRASKTAELPGNRKRIKCMMCNTPFHCEKGTPYVRGKIAVDPESLSSCRKKSRQLENTDQSDSRDSAARLLLNIANEKLEAARARKEARETTNRQAGDALKIAHDDHKEAQRAFDAAKMTLETAKDNLEVAKAFEGRSSTDLEYATSEMDDAAARSESLKESLSTLVGLSEGKADGDGEGAAPKEDRKEYNGTVAGLLCQAKFNLRSSNISSYVDVNRNAAKVFNFLTTAIRTWGAGDGDGPSVAKEYFLQDKNGCFLCVSGKPGTGKTMTVRLCCELAKKWAANDKGDTCTWDASPIISTSNGYNAAQIFAQIAESLGLSARASAADIGKIIKRSKRQQRRMIILVFELPDTELPRAARQVVNTLFRWAVDPRYALALVAISNLTVYRSLRQKTMVFLRYSQEQLKSIVEGRAVYDVFDAPTLELIVRKVASGSRNARHVLELAASSVAMCIESLSADMLRGKIVVPNSTPSGGDSEEKQVLPVVKLRHVMKAVREAETITKLPEVAKVTLCVAVTISHHLQDSAIIPIRELYGCCKRSCAYGLLDDLTTAEFSDVLEMLRNAGLLTIGDNDMPGNEYQQEEFGYSSNAGLKLGVQLIDVECALDKTLKNEKFYQNLITYVNEKGLNSR